MLADINLFGVFVDVRFATAVAALLLGMPLRRLLGALGAYRVVWHPALVDLALFVLLWGAVAWVAIALPSRLVPYLG
jgi:hypothetical protein